MSEINIERLRAKVELAEVRLAMCKSADYELSLLAELQIAWDRWRRRLAPARRTTGRGIGSAAYLHQISDRNPDRG